MFRTTDYYVFLYLITSLLSEFILESKPGLAFLNCKSTQEGECAMRNTGSESATVGNHCAEETSGFLSDFSSVPNSCIAVTAPEVLLFPYSNLPGKAGDIRECF
jgi:hypothetical protein